MKIIYMLSSILSATLTTQSPISTNGTVEVCDVAYQGAVYRQCNFDYGMSNACKCYFQGDRSVACTYFLNVAILCDKYCQTDRTCQRNPPVNPYATPLPDVCKVAFQGAKFKECDFDWAFFNVANCYFFKDNREEILSLVRQGANNCDGNCTATGDCKPH